MKKVKSFDSQSIKPILYVLGYILESQRITQVSTRTPTRSVNYRKGQIPVHDYEIVDSKVQVYDDIAICTMQYHGSVNGQAGPPWKATDVYRLIDGDWKMVHGHWSLVKSQ